MEALIGASFVDGGWAPAQDVVRRLFGEIIASTEVENWSKDPKTELQEWLQGRKMKLPLYKVVGTMGAAHKQSFDVECEIPELRLNERGIGGSRRTAEQAAATAMVRTWPRPRIASDSDTLLILPESLKKPELDNCSKRVVNAGSVLMRRVTLRRSTSGRLSSVSSSATTLGMLGR